jgi:hypothetical protein
MSTHSLSKSDFLWQATLESLVEKEPVLWREGLFETMWWLHSTARLITRKSLFTLFILEWMNQDIFECMEWSLFHVTYLLHGLEQTWKLELQLHYTFWNLISFYLYGEWWRSIQQNCEMDIIFLKSDGLFCVCACTTISTRIMSMLSRSSLLHDGWNDWNGHCLTHASCFCQDGMSLGTRSKSKSVANEMILGTRRKPEKIEICTTSMTKSRCLW